MKTFTIATLGCKVNQYDSQLIREGLRARGLRECGNGNARVDVCIINTCTVTESSEAKSRRAVRRAAREHPGAAVIVTGCCADVNPGAFASLPNVSRVMGNRLKGRIAHIAGGGAVTEVRSISSFSAHTRAFVKIQDGCNFNCSYCILPRVRGRPWSRPPDEVIAEARTLAANGYAEIVLTGIHLGAYGKDYSDPSALTALIGELERIEELKRIRLSSIEPKEVTDELIGIMASGGKLCPHLHIPLQSGDKRVLEAMRRNYSPDDYGELVERVRSRVPDASLTTDIMIGFPSESEEAFLRTLEMVRRAEFSRVHVFTFSPRPGTAALGMGDPVPHAVKEQRRKILAGVAGETAKAYGNRFVGRCVEVLVQGRSRRRAGTSCGITREYLRVCFEGNNHLEGRICRVFVEGLDFDGLRGRVKKDGSESERSPLRPAD